MDDKERINICELIEILKDYAIDNSFDYLRQLKCNAVLGNKKNIKELDIFELYIRTLDLIIDIKTINEKEYKNETKNNKF